MGLAKADRIVRARLNALGYSYSVPIDVSGELTPVPYTPPYVPPSTPVYGPPATSPGAPPINWNSILTTGLTQAGNVASVALKPPLYTSSINYPGGGSSSVSSYGPGLPGTTFGSLTGSVSPLLWLGALALGAVLLLRR